MPFLSLTQTIVVRGNTIESEGQLSVQSDDDNGVTAVNCVVEHNAVTAKTHPPPHSGPALLLSANNSGWVVRQNTCDGKPCP